MIQKNKYLTLKVKHEKNLSSFLDKSKITDKNKNLF